MSVIWVRLTHEELALLRRGQARQLKLRREPGSRTPGEGDPVRVYAAAVREDGAVVRKRATLRCRITLVQREESCWTVTYGQGQVAKPRFLTARPGKRGDYTTELRYAMKDEPECVPESWERREERVTMSIVNPRARRVQRIRPTAH